MQKDTVVSHRSMLKIALPVAVANISTPMLGIVDTAIVSHSGSVPAIGAVAVGALIFAFLYWGFGFLRMGTTGLTAQAHGAADRTEQGAILARAMLTAMAIGAAIIVLQRPISIAAFELLGETVPELEYQAHLYYEVRVWGSPATLVNYALVGWLIGMGLAGQALLLQLLMNVANLALDAFFVLYLGMLADGVALGTVLAESIAMVAGVLLVLRIVRGQRLYFPLLHLRRSAPWKKLLGVNFDLMARTLGLLFVLAWFTFHGARAGTTILAANVILMHMVNVSAFILDGFAYATEVLIGRAQGARALADWDQAVRLATVWAASVALLLSLVIWLGGERMILALTLDQGVRLAAVQCLPWVALVPILGIWCFQLDGIFIGATETGPMRNTTFLVIAVYLCAWQLLVGPYGNHGRWMSLALFYVARGLTLGSKYPALRQKIGALAQGVSKAKSGTAAVRDLTQGGGCAR